MKYEEAVSRCWAEIDVDALLENYRTAHGMLAPECELICVLKANAYGVGARRPWMQTSPLPLKRGKPST